METNREPLPSMNYNPDNFLSDENELDFEITDIESQQLNDLRDFANNLDNPNLENFHVTRSQKRAFIKDSKKRFSKMEYNFRKFLDFLSPEKIIEYRDNYNRFAGNNFKKAELDVIQRGINQYNQQSKSWEKWQLDLMEDKIKRLQNDNQKN